MRGSKWGRALCHCLLLLFAVAQAACAYSVLARDTFAGEFACPVRGVRVTRLRLPTPRPGGFAAALEPPSDVAADPERLQLWNLEHGRTSRVNDERSNRLLQAAANGVYLAEGCRQQALYTCSKCVGGKCRSSFECSQVTADYSGRLRLALLESPRAKP